AKRPVYIIDLLNMTAGLDYKLHSEPVERVIERTSGRAPTVEIAEAIGEAGLCFQPGERYSYSLCIDIIGAIIEVASGERFSDFVRTRILEPLGMKNTGFTVTDKIKERIAPLYEYKTDEGRFIRRKCFNGYVFGSEYDCGGAGLYSCVDDYIEFASMLSNLGVGSSGVRILSEDSVNFIRENHLDKKQLDSFRSTNSYLKGYGYGCAVRTAMEPSLSDKFISVGEFGWCGAAGAMLLADPENHLAVYYAQHMLNNQEWIVHPRLREAIYKGIGIC
ncbi:MAG: serine hydrolase domain-containing protein, partial [Eubacteriales bacterium]